MPKTEKKLLATSHFNHLLLLPQHNVTVGNEPDLLWAIRGAGSAFGVVTKLVLRLNDISNAYTGKMVWQDDPKHETWK